LSEEIGHKMQSHKNSALDRNGNVLSGATITVTKVSDGSVAILYSDNGTTTITLPLTSDADGEFQFWADDDRYNVTTTYSGSTDTYELILYDSVVDRTVTYTTDIASDKKTPNSYKITWYDSNKVIGSGTTWTYTGVNTPARAGDGLYTRRPWH